MWENISDKILIFSSYGIRRHKRIKYEEERQAKVRGENDFWFWFLGNDSLPKWECEAASGKEPLPDGRKKKKNIRGQ